MHFFVKFLLKIEGVFIHTQHEGYALVLGSTGIYLLLLSLLLISLAIISWIIVRVIRNVNEREDPLLALEVSWDL
jgi:hypothetical protein